MGGKADTGSTFKDFGFNSLDPFGHLGLAKNATAKNQEKKSAFQMAAQEAQRRQALIDAETAAKTEADRRRKEAARNQTVFAGGNQMAGTTTSTRTLLGG